MDILNIVLLVIILFTLLFLILKTKSGFGNEILELKKQIEEMKIKQIEAQTEALRQQQELFVKTQDSMVNQLQTILKVVNDNLISTQGNINNQLQTILKTVNDNLTNTQGNITNQLKVVGDIEKKLGALQETARQIQEIGQDISSLQEIFKTSKIRGNIGEMLLEDLLGQIFTKENFQRQYKFKDNTIVDAVIKLGNKLIPIDSKFPLEDFQRIVEAKDNKSKGVAKTVFIKNVKKKIDDIAENYIKPDEGTYDFAIMYIPAENVYYEAVINESFREDESKERENELLNYAIQKHVIPVSPNSMYAYLMAIAYGLKGFKLEQATEKILSRLNAIVKDFNSFQDSFKVLGTHLTYAIGKYEETKEHSRELGLKINQIVEIKESDTKQLEFGK